LPASRPKPRRPCPIEGKAEQKNTLFLLEEKVGGARKIKNCKEYFSARRAAVIGGGAASIGQEFLIK
jgi:hypothetical protein